MPDPLTDLEHLVLLAVLRIEGGAYGVAVADLLADRAGRTVTLGTLYNTLMRLEERGLVASEMGDPAPVRGGKAKRLFQVTEKGSEALEHTHAVFERMREGIAPPGRAR